jgi:hypothetical protein
VSAALIVSLVLFLAWFSLVAAIAVTAVATRDENRRKAALTVLRMLLTRDARGRRR